MAFARRRGDRFVIRTVRLGARRSQRQEGGPLYEQATLLPLLCRAAREASGLHQAGAAAMANRFGLAIAAALR